MTLLRPDAPFRIASVTTELAPLAKVGGLADVAAALSARLAERGHAVTVLMPGYPSLDRSDLETLPAETVHLPWNGTRRTVRLERARLGRVELALLEDPLVPDEPYRHARERDEAWCYGLLCAVAARWLAPRCDLLHLHDHHAALTVALLDGQPRPATLFNIHNLFYQGVWSRQHLRPAGLPRGTRLLKGHRGRVNAMRTGVRGADAVVAVSPTYAREILGAEHGCGLEQELAARGEDLVGILNGIDTRAWDPASDAHLAATFHAGDLSGKRACRRALAEELGLDAGRPLIGMVGRLTRQKGLDLLLPVLDAITRRAELCVLGSGDAAIEADLRGAAGPHVAVRLGFDEALAHRIEAGADLFLMPSRFEPCGLNQMISMRYGTLPVVRRTGGLADTVQDADDPAGTGYGFLFDEARPEALLAAVNRALDALRDGRGDELARRAMAVDVGWSRSASRYEALMRELLSRPCRRSYPGSCRSRP